MHPLYSEWKNIFFFFFFFLERRKCEPLSLSQLTRERRLERPK
jgi:hypothetical protein